MATALESSAQKKKKNSPGKLESQQFESIKGLMPKPVAANQ